MNLYNHEAEFEATTSEDQRVRVHIPFNIEEDDMEVLQFSRLVFKKCYGIEMGKITAYFIETSEPYTPTDEDLIEWKFDIQRTLQQELNRQTA